MSNRRRALGSAVVSAIIAGSLATPALGDNPIGSKIVTVPDAGARPVPMGQIMLPTGLLPVPATLPTAAIDALQAQITAAGIETSLLEAKLNALIVERADARLATALADHIWRQTADKLREAREAAEIAAKEAFLAAAELPPDMAVGGALRDLSALQPRVGATRSVSEAAALDLNRAQTAEREAFATLTAATDREKVIADTLAVTQTTYAQRAAALAELNKRLADLKSAEDRKAEQDAQSSGYDVGKSNNGLVANKRAQDAVKFALTQRGKPYRWGDEGPNSYDCSGIVWASYTRSGVTVNRIANDQYYGTRNKPVTISSGSLLPGDLLFFATNPSDWRTIHHVAMYIGDGLMLHAPATGDVVRVVPVRWSAIDFATRVVDATPVPTQTTPPATSTPSPTASASASTPASPSPSASASRPASPSPSASASPPPVVEPEPEPEPETSTSPNPAP